MIYIIYYERDPMRSVTYIPIIFYILIHTASGWAAIEFLRSYIYIMHHVYVPINTNILYTYISSPAGAFRQYMYKRFNTS